MHCDEPLLITGTYRSGTTLISQMVNNHPELGVVYDSVNFMRFCFSQYDPVGSTAVAMKLVQDVHDRILSRWNMAIDVEAVRARLQSSGDISYAVLYDEIMYQLCMQERDTRIWGEKTTLCWREIPAFFDMFRHGRVLHIYRDPRAVLVSWKKMTTAPGLDYLDAILNCADSMDAVTRYRSTLSGHRYVAVRFEDLVRDPEATLRTTCDALDIEFHPAMLDVAGFKDKAGKPWKGNSQFSAEQDSISPSPVRDWEGRIEPWESWLVQTSLQDRLAAFDYHLQGVTISNEEAERIAAELASSEFLARGFLHLALRGEGQQRFPSDPLDSKTWGHGEKG